MSDRPEEDDDLIPVSVRLGEVVPPEDPEDWTQPLTWVAATGMLLGPVLALVWFATGAPSSASPVQAGTVVLACGLAFGAVLTGATQQGWLRALTATLAAALFAALVTVLIGAAMAGERQVGEASPTLAHAFGGALAGVGGAAAAAPLAAVVAGLHGRLLRLLVPGAIAVSAAWLLARLLLGTATPI